MRSGCRTGSCGPGWPAGRFVLGCPAGCYTGLAKHELAPSRRQDFMEFVEAGDFLRCAAEGGIVPDTRGRDGRTRDSSTSFARG
jgi:hypothetical protein